MSILSRLLKREEESPPPAPNPSGNAPPGPGAVHDPLNGSADVGHTSGASPSEGTEPNAQLPATLLAEAPDQPSRRPSTPTQDEPFPLVGTSLNGAAAPLSASLPATVATAPALSPADARLVAQAAPIRNLMMEVRWGETQVRWVNLARPALQSLRAMLPELQRPELAEPLGALAAAFDRATRSAATVLNAEARQALLSAHQSLAEQMPEAFAIEAEMARREPLIVESLLAQVAELEPLHRDKLAAVGLDRLTNLLPVTAEEIVLVAGLPEPVAAALADKLHEWKRSSIVGVSADPSVARRPLEMLVGRLELHHQNYERAAAGWSESDVAAKRRARRERERAFQAVRAALVRLGEVERVIAIDKLPSARRIEELGKVLREPAGAPGSR